MFNDRIYLGHNNNSSRSYRSSYTTSSPVSSRKNYTSPSSSSSPSAERLNVSFNRGKDGIFRPKSLLSLATEIDFVSSNSISSSIPKSVPITIGSNPRLASVFRSHHRESSVPRHTDSGYSSPRTRTRTIESNFYSNFNDNLNYLSSPSQASYQSRHRTSYLPSTNYQSHKFTTSYYAPKVRERPLLSNLRVKFASRNHSSSSSRNTSISSSSSHHNSVSSNETLVPPRLERNKFLIKFREHNLSQNSNERSKRRNSISWNIPGAVNFAKGTGQVDVAEAIQENEPELSNGKGASELSPTPSNGQLAESEIDRDENNNLTRWNGSMALNTLEETDICDRNGAIKEPEPVEDRLQSDQLCERCDLCLSEEQQHLPLKTIDLIGSAPNQENKQTDNDCEQIQVLLQSEDTNKVEKAKKKKKKVEPKPKDVSIDSKASDVTKEVNEIKEIEVENSKETKEPTETKVLKKAKLKESKDVEGSKETNEIAETKVLKKTRVKENKDEIVKEPKEIKEETETKVIKKAKVKESLDIEIAQEQKENKENAETKVLKKARVKTSIDVEESKEAKEAKETKETTETKVLKKAKVKESKDVEVTKETLEPKEAKVTKVVKKVKEIKENQMSNKVNQGNGPISIDTFDKKQAADRTENNVPPETPSKVKSDPKQVLKPKTGRSNDTSPSKRAVVLSTDKLEAKSTSEPFAKDSLQVNHQEDKSRSVSPEPSKLKVTNKLKKEIVSKIEENKPLSEPAKTTKTVTFSTDITTELKSQELSKNVAKKAELGKFETKPNATIVSNERNECKPAKVRVEPVLEPKVMASVITVNGSSIDTTKELTKCNQIESDIAKVKAKKKKKESSEKETDEEKVIKKKVKKRPTQELVTPANEVDKCVPLSPTKKETSNELLNTPNKAKQTPAHEESSGPKLKEASIQAKPKRSVKKAPKKIQFREYTIDDFTFLKVLGRGSFGKVLLAELSGCNICFAVKCLKKQTVIEDDDVESIMIERKVLAFGSSNPFICKLFCTFQTESHLFFAMEWCAGGDLMFHVQKEGKFSEEKARFYTCEMLCALWFLHKRGIIYRDLKLDNIMVYNDGHIRLVDFGMCQGKMYREELLPSNFCGTPEYMAPEIIKGVKYNHSVDYWALGIVIYEMCVGTSPFQGTDEDELLWNVCHQDVHYPRFLSSAVKDLIVLLLRRDPQERIGMNTCTAGTIESQPWLNGINWKMVENCKTKPPFIPELIHQTDVSYFDQYFTKEDPSISPNSKPISEKDQLLFEGFNYTNHNMTE